MVLHGNHELNLNRKSLSEGSVGKGGWDMDSVLWERMVGQGIDLRVLDSLSPEVMII